MESAEAITALKTTPYLLEGSYIVYLLISISLTIWVARTLRKGGKVFLIDVFKKEDLAESVNHLLVVGFYLINLGYVSLALKSGYIPESIGECIEMLSRKIGAVLLILGGMHFFNMFVFSRIRKPRRTVPLVVQPMIPQPPMSQS